MNYMKKAAWRRSFAKVVTAMLLGLIMAGCTPLQQCTDVRLKLEADGYLDGWVYLQDIESLDDEQNPVGRILFALYENEETPGEYAVLHMTKMTVPNTYDGYFVKVTYDKEQGTAHKLGDRLMNIAAICDETGIQISVKVMD